jgi:hypothetical protein
MTLEELVNTLNRFRDEQGWEYNKGRMVRVVISDDDGTFAGPLPTTDVDTVMFGFDWDCNSFLLFTKDGLVRKNTMTT